MALTGIRHPRLDSQVRAMFEADPPGDFTKMDPTANRQPHVPASSQRQTEGSFVERSIPGPGGPLAIRLHRPSGDGPHPAIIYLHGGGFVFGDLDGTDQNCRVIADLAQCVVISVDYRLAPQTKFPGAHEDVYAALTWVAGHATDLGIDPSRIAVGGMSAGANLASAVAAMSRDRGGPTIAFQLLIQGMFEPRCDAPSHAAFGGISFPSAAPLWFMEHLFARAEDRDHPYVALLRAPDLSGLPPALVVTGECDPLRDEAEAYGRRLQDAGVETEVRRYDGMPHGLFGLPVDTSKRAFDEVFATLKERLTSRQDAAHAGRGLHGREPAT
ncbi:MAG: alpha/beta hydrolase [Chloroflexota bacterium]|nr:alpha/beta hydrolase [Chloroflexota bacterium]